MTQAPYTDLEGQHIDPTHWHSGPILTPERIAKGDLRIEKYEHKDAVRFAQVQVRNVMNFLYEAGTLDDQHVHDGQTFEVWQMSFTAELSCRPNPIYSSELRSVRRTLEDDDLAHDDYAKLLRGLSRAHIKAVEQAIKAPANEHNARLATLHAATYRQAFDRLGVVMERLRAQYRARQDAEN